LFVVSACAQARAQHPQSGQPREPHILVEAHVSYPELVKGTARLDCAAERMRRVSSGHGICKLHIRLRQASK
jgi:hypothetical protein